MLLEIRVGNIHQRWIIVIIMQRRVAAACNQGLSRRFWGWAPATLSSFPRSSAYKSLHQTLFFSTTTRQAQDDDNHVTIVEVGPRDGLQNEKVTPLTVEQRVELIRLLVQAGCPKMEVGSFVSPQWVPAMADSDLVYQQVVAQQQQSSSSSNVNRSPTFSCLVPNQRGLQEALRVQVDEIAIFAAASETFSKKVRNVRCVYSQVSLSVNRVRQPKLMTC